jgi:hypothetical protein
MNKSQINDLQKLKEIQLELSSGWIDYWHRYSSFDTWQFWVNVAMLLIPLVVLYFTIDRKRAFHLGFFGFNIHVCAAYIDGFATRHGLWEYPFKAIPFLPISFGLDTSLIPVVYILLYQWTIKNKKNYYLYAVIISALFSFVFKPILSAHHLIELGNGINYLHLFPAYLIVAFISKWITNVFYYLESR